jgi:hypothetical protein
MAPTHFVALIAANMQKLAQKPTRYRKEYEYEKQHDFGVLHVIIRSYSEFGSLGILGENRGIGLAMTFMSTNYIITDLQ